jgi:hypothetical protein
VNLIAWTALLLILGATLHTLWHVLKQQPKYTPAHRASKRRPSGDLLTDYSYDDEDPWAYVRNLAGDDPTPEEMERIVANVRRSAREQVARDE